MEGRRLQALVLGLALLLPTPAVGAEDGGAFDPLVLGGLGFRLVEGPSIPPYLEGRDGRGDYLRVSPSRALPWILYCFDARFPASARMALGGLESLRMAQRGRLGVLAFSPASPEQLARAIDGLSLGFPVFSSSSLPADLGLSTLPAWLLVAPGGRAGALRYGDFDWAGTEGRTLLALILAAWPPQGPNAATFLSEAEEKLLGEVNLARTSPRVYASFLRDYEVGLRSGDLAEVEEAIAFLERQRPLEELGPSRGLSAAARAWLEGGAAGQESFLAILDGLGQWRGTTGATLVADPPLGGRASAARGLVFALILSRGDSSRASRRALFNEDYRRLGLALGAGPAGRGCALAWAWDFVEKP